MSAADLLAELIDIAGREQVRTDAEALALAANDVHETGQPPLALVRPTSAAMVAGCIRAATARGYAIAPRGGGLSYTAGYVPASEKAVTLDLSGLNRIVSVDPEDMTITVEAGVTWKQIYAVLKPYGLRLPFFGTFSGLGATVGGGLSHGALFFGSARYGSAAEMVLGLEVACADGSLLRTGQGALKVQAKAFLRSFGPDLTGLFVHDGGTLGVKTQATFRLISAPKSEDYLSFAFPDMYSAAAALSAIAREDLVEEIYIIDPASTDNLVLNAPEALRSAAAVARASTGPVKAVRNLVGMAKAGTDFVPAGHFSLHMTVAGRSAAAVKADLVRAQELGLAAGGLPVAPTIPRVSRADLFANLNGVLGPGGERWAALNAKVAHSDAASLITAYFSLIERHRARMDQLGVQVTFLGSALANHSFSFEPVFRWHDAWLPIHRAVAEPGHLRGFNEPAPAPDARALVNQLRSETVELFRAHGAASNQIGRTYPYFSALADEPASLLLAIKQHLDPLGLMNPGVLEIPVPGT